jgi:hypothetical protein
MGGKTNQESKKAMIKAGKEETAPKRSTADTVPRLWCKFDTHDNMHPKPERLAFCAVRKLGQMKRGSKETRTLCPSFSSIDVLNTDINQKAPETP